MGVRRMRYFAAGFLDGRINHRELPLADVTLRAGLGHTPGEMSAALDMAAMVEPRDWDAAKEVLYMLTAGTVSILPFAEDDDTGDEALVGEWWLARRERQYSSPVVKLAGVEFPGYLAETAIQSDYRESKADPVAMMRRMLAGLITENGGRLILSVGAATSPTTVPVDVIAGSTDYASAFREMRGDAFEWRVDTQMVSDVQLARILRVGVPKLVTDRGDIAVELKTPGSDPASALDVSAADSVDSIANYMYAFGAGSGRGQKRVHKGVSRDRRMPMLARTLSAHDVQTTAKLVAEMEHAMAGMDPLRTPITVPVFTSALPLAGPTVGDTYSWFTEPSLSFPSGRVGTARVLGWEWQSQRPEITTLTLERVETNG